MAAKIKDGLFIGDAETSQSEVFINDNKISNLINLSGREVQNVWAPHGLVYLTYYWEDTSNYKIFSSHDDSLLSDIVEFIDVSISHGISVLLFSTDGKSRCIVAACIYLMMKYRWGFEKTFDYVYSKKPDANVNKGFIQQMFSLDMKLLASRQKLFTTKYGNNNMFKIEANMTISDISTMLPTNEAKRWNSWDADYILSSTTENKEIVDMESKSNEHKSEYKRSSKLGVRNRLDNASNTIDDDELILIYSFLNSKNTINSLPGPYPNIYDTPKSFKLRFNAICYEEDINWFPPTSTRHHPVRSIMKGSHHKANDSHVSVAQPKSIKHTISNSNSVKRTNGDFKYDILENLDQDLSSMNGNTQLYINNSNHSENEVQTNRSDGLNGSSNTTFQNQHQLSSDLYEFVGLSNLSNAESISRKKGDRGNSWGPRDSINIHKAFEEESQGGMRSNKQPTPSNQSSIPLTAEDRLRNLMADMQKQKNSSNFNREENVVPIGPSLYDLATMKIPGSNNNTGNQQIQTPLDYEDDLLYAFNQQVYQTSKNNGAVRARHDILTRSSNNGVVVSNSRSTGGPSSGTTRTAWGTVPSPGNNSNRTSTPTTSGATTRPASPSVNRQNPATNTSYSIASVNSNGSGNSFAGSGMNSAAKIYRLGSPAPSSRVPTGSNNRHVTNNSNKPLHSSNNNMIKDRTSGDSNSIANSSISSLGSGIAAVGLNNNIGNNYQTANIGNKYNLDPYLAGAASPQLVSQQRRNPVSDTTVTNISDTIERRRIINNSPLRASYTTNTTPASPNVSGNSNLGGVSGRRYSTTTPQSNMHHDYDSGTAYNSANTGNSIGSNNKRSSTPTKHAWKF